LHFRCSSSSSFEGVIVGVQSGKETPFDLASQLKGLEIMINAKRSRMRDEDSNNRNESNSEALTPNFNRIVF
jgi:hypothetical protein